MGHDAANAQTPIVIQFSHVVTPDTAKGKAALRFKELAESRTSGKVRVEIYPNSQLYKDREELDALRLGAVQMIAPSLSKLSGLGGGDFEVFDLPFLFKDRSAFRAAVDGPVGASLLKKLEPHGVKGLAYWDNGFKVFSANRPLQSVADFKALKVRVQASRVLVTQMKALGAQVSVSPLANVYEALRSGQLDGQENTPTNIETQRLHDVQRHLTVSNHGYLAYAVLVNKPFWDKLPPDIRIALEGALQDASVFENSIASSENSKALDRIKSSGKLTVHTATPQELNQWRAALLPVYKEAQGWISVETLRSLNALDGPPL
ncbi:MAG: DctP family TRAP transporter solute-binding subunit [Burkholderiales bacterium]|nr:DctP family TRAP transporter solute-binding subunit [Burkholderiales bacterium]